MPAASKNSLGVRDTLRVGNQDYEVHRLEALERRGIGHVGQLPFSIRILLENLLRQEDGRFVHAKDIEALAEWQPLTDRRAEIAFMPARVLLQDFTGVPAVADLAAMRDAIAKMGGDPKKINPLLPAELVIDHSWPSRLMPKWSFSATWSVINFCAGARALFGILRSCRQIWASAIR
jgi:aconitate hydratase